MKKRYFCLAPIVLLLCSFVEGNPSYGYVGVTICSYNDTNLIETPTLFSGHSYVIIQNNRSWTLDLGHYQLPPFAYCTVGLWGGSGSSSSSSSESGSSNSETRGVYFNREAFILTREGENAERSENCVRYSVSVLHGNFVSRMYQNTSNNQHFLIEKADTYNLAAYNCSQFATDFFERATGIDITFCANPTYLMDSIMGFENHYTDNTNFSKEEYFKYTVNGDVYYYE